MDDGVTVEKVSRLYEGGVEAIQRVAATLDGAGWERTVCGQWTGTETARHLLAVAGWYHSWLDRAIAGDASTPFPVTDMDQQNEVALAQIGAMSGPDAIGAFTASATTYLERAADHWELPFGYPSGTVTVGLHCGVAATEWHLHAWDLSRATGQRHQPDDPERLFMAAGLCVAAAQGGVRGTVLRRLVPLGSRRKPWESLLQRSGRDSSA